MLDHIVNITSLIVALVALAVAVYSWGTATRAARNDVLAQVRDWGGDVVDLLGDARALCDSGLTTKDTEEHRRQFLPLIHADDSGSRPFAWIRG